MEQEKVIYERDILGLCAANEDDAKYIAKETLEFMNKKNIIIGSAIKNSGKDSYEVVVYYEKEKIKKLTLNQENNKKIDK